MSHHPFIRHVLRRAGMMPAGGGSSTKRMHGLEHRSPPTHERVVEHRKIITAAGVSSGIDMALRLAQRIAGDDVAQAIQLATFAAGSPHKVPPHVVDFLRGASEEVIAQRRRSIGGDRPAQLFGLKPPG